MEKINPKIQMLFVGGRILERAWTWITKILSFESIKEFAIRQRGDFLILIVLAILAGTGSFLGSQLVSPDIIEFGGSQWFEADLSEAYKTMVSRTSQEQYRTGLHPLFPLATYPGVKILDTIIGVQPLTAVKVDGAIVAMLWISTLFVLIRLIGCTRLDATLFSLLGISSAAAMFFLVVPETYPWGSLSILLAFCLVALAQRTKLSSFWYVVMSAITLSFTVTNWMAGIITTVLDHPWKRSLQITVNAFCLVVILWGVEKQLFPSAQFFLYLPPDRVRFILAPFSGGPHNIINSFFFHSMVMPAFDVIDKNHTWQWPVLVTQYSRPGTGSIWGAVAIGLWVVLLGLGIWSLFFLGRNQNFRIALGLMLLGQLLLCLVYGDETFLYSLHFAPLLVVLVALSTQTRMRTIARIMVVALVISAGFNNFIQFFRAINIIRQIPLGLIP
jgi:hypothetical protein